MSVNHNVIGSSPTIHVRKNLFNFSSSIVKF